MVASALGVMAVAAFVVADAEGVDAIQWCYIFHPTDFDTWSRAIEFFAELRVPIPPILAAAEIASQNLFDSTAPVRVGIYRAAWVASFGLAALVAGGGARRPVRAVVSAVLGVVFVWGGVKVHAGNPQVYDILFPALVLLATVSLAAHGESRRRRVVWAGLAGTAVALFELTRPFALVPAVLWTAAGIVLLARGERRSRSALTAFVVPIALLSGVWHLHLLIRHDQLLWTNHSGYNLQRAWEQVPLPPLEVDPDRAPLASGRWPNLNTETHARNSDRWRRVIGAWIVKHPLQSLDHALERMAYVASAPTSIYMHRPKHAIFGAYRVLVFGAVLWMLAEGILLVVAFARDRSAVLRPRSLLLVTALFTFAVLSLGEAGEEARFAITMLPMLAALPAAESRHGSRGVSFGDEPA